MPFSPFRVVQHNDPIHFLAKAETWLRQAECENGRVLGLALEEQATDAHSSLFLTVEQAGQVHGSAALAKDGTLDVGILETNQAELLKAILYVIQDDVARIVTSPLTDNESILDNFTKKHTMRLYDCHIVKPIDTAPGKFRHATLNDLERLADWWTAFQTELSLPGLNDNPRTVMKKRIEQQTAYVWEEDSLVTMACCGRSTGNGIAIFNVYTPPDRRGRGFGTACTAALTQHLLDSDFQFCCLFADDANPTTNHIYQKIGYQFVGMTQMWEKQR